MSAYWALLMTAACHAGAVGVAADFEAPPAPYQTVPRPADGETVSANPPCFVYPATQLFDSYLVEVSRSPTFPTGETMRLTSPYMLACPAEAMAPGKYYWRWRPQTGGGGEDRWSPVRAFALPESAPVVPFPDITALVARLGRSHPRVEVTAQDLAATRDIARQRLGDAWLAEVRRGAERAQAADLLPEPDFLPDYSDPRRVELYQKTFTTTRPFFREMASLAEHYLLTGNELSGQEAKRRLLHIISWDPRGSTSLGHNDEPATEVLRYCPTTFDRVYALLTPEERQRCLDCLMVRMTEMRDWWRRRPFEKHPYESHNMGYYLPDMVQASVALAGEAPVAEMLQYAMLQLWSPFYPPYGDADGGWSEGPSYWSWSAAVFARTYRLVEHATGVPVHLRSHLRNQWLYKLYGNPPYFKMSPFGDGQEGEAGGGSTMALLAGLYQLPYAKWYAEWQNVKLTGMDALLFDSGDLKARSPHELPQGHAFFDVGVAAMHSALADPADNVAVLMRSCPFGSISHAYADQNSFVLDAYGEPLIIASGYYQLYGQPHHVEWTWETKASNSVLVNGQGQAKRDWDAKGRLVVFETTAAGDYVVGDATAAYKGRLQRFDRHILFLRPVHTGGEPIVVIRDHLVAPEPATFQFLLHALHEMQVDAGAQRITIANGRARCRVEYLAPSGLEFSQTDQFTTPPIRQAPNQWHLTADTARPSSGTDSLIVLQPHRQGAEDELLAAQMERRTIDGVEYHGVRLSGDGRELLVLFRTEQDTQHTPAEGISTDAQALSLCWSRDTGALRSAVMFAGSRLRNGTLELRAEQPGAVSISRLATQAPVMSSDTPAGTRLSVGGQAEETWLQGSGPMVKVAAAAPSPPAALLRMRGGEPTAFALNRYDWVQRTVARATTSSPGGHHRVAAIISNLGDGPLPLVLAAGASVRHVLPPRTDRAELTLPAADLGAGREITLSADESLGGRLALHEASAERVYGVELLPNGSLEEALDGVPAGWRPMTITRNAQANIASVEGGRGGARCLEVICTQATGGDFGATLSWPGIAASEVDRRFRMSCWVKTDATSVAGLQVANRDWTWGKITPRLRDCAQWAEAALEFVLPAGENLTHVRLHMNAEKTGARLLVDDVSLVELPAE